MEVLFERYKIVIDLLDKHDLERARLFDKSYSHKDMYALKGMDLLPLTKIFNYLSDTFSYTSISADNPTVICVWIFMYVSGVLPLIRHLTWGKIYSSALEIYQQKTSKTLDLGLPLHKISWIPILGMFFLTLRSPLYLLLPAAIGCVVLTFIVQQVYISTNAHLYFDVFNQTNARVLEGDGNAIKNQPNDIDKTYIICVHVVSLGTAILYTLICQQKTIFILLEHIFLGVVLIRNILYASKTHLLTKYVDSPLTMLCFIQAVFRGAPVPALVSFIILKVGESSSLRGSKLYLDTPDFSWWQ
ncbi:unnamed protein product [Gordionus sp. m RMFG-2023]